MHVDVSKDLKHAKVYVSVMGTEEEKNEVLTAFAHAAPFIRRMLGSRLRLKKIPDLRFELDRTVDDHFRIESLLASNKWKKEA
jgi:ribosome-binding factor A